MKNYDEIIKLFEDALKLEVGFESTTVKQEDKPKKARAPPKPKAELVITKQKVNN